MPKLAPKQLDCYEFGRRLIDTLDLDPVYVLAHNADWDNETQLKMWLLSYWCFYHVGTASWITDKGYNSYWERMRQAAASKDYPRSAERRHYRGPLAVNSIEWLAERGLTGVYGALTTGYWTVDKVIKYVKTWYGFGDWIAFKVADMLERLHLSEITFDNASIFLFDSPKEGARMLCDWEVPIAKRTTSHECAEAIQDWAIKRILEELGDTLAPPDFERLVNAQEAETILCKWKSYLDGHYEIGEDIAACRRALLRFSRCRLSQRLLAGGRKGGLWTS